MKGKLTLFAAAAALALPMVAQAEIYGRIQAGLEYLDDDDPTTDDWDVGSGGHSRWGIVGAEDLGNGLKGIYQYEYSTQLGIDGDGSTVAVGERTRLAYVGLQGDFGKLTIGRNWLPTFRRLAPPASWGQMGRNVSRAYLEVIGSTRRGQVITYDTPNMNGFQAGVATVFSNTDAAGEDGIDRWAIAANYKSGPFFIGGAYEGHENIDDRYGIAANYSFDPFTIRGAWYGQDPDVGDELNGFVIGGTGDFGNNTVKVFYEDWETAATDDNSQIRLLFHHHMSKTFHLFAEYNHIERDFPGPDVEEDHFEVGFLQFWKL